MSSFENINQAVRNGTIEDVRFFIEQKGADVNAEDEGGYAPFFLAMYTGKLEVAKYLVSKGASCNVKYHDGGSTPLHVYSTHEYADIDKVKFLISIGADVNEQDANGYRPLHCAAIDLDNGVATAEALISAGANIDAKQEDGWTPLHLTAEVGNIEVAKLLISGGANVNEKNHKGQTPLYLAKTRDKYEIVRYLKSKGGKKGGCYIATAVYGSYDCPQVWTLRRYRDYALANNIFGSIFISIYYSISPIMVRLFGKTGWFTRFCRNGLDKLVDSLQRRGYIGTPYCD